MSRKETLTRRAMAPKDADQTETEQTEASGPMLDMSQADVKKMIAKAKAKGYITYDKLNRVLPSDQFSSEGRTRFSLS